MGGTAAAGRDGADGGEGGLNRTKTSAWAWQVGRMGRAGTAQGEAPPQRWRKPIFPPEQPSGEQQPGSVRWADAVRITVAEIFALAEIANHCRASAGWSFENYPEPNFMCSKCFKIKVGGQYSSLGTRKRTLFQFYDGSTTRCIKL